MQYFFLKPHILFSSQKRGWLSSTTPLPGQHLGYSSEGHHEVELMVSLSSLTQELGSGGEGGLTAGGDHSRKSPRPASIPLLLQIGAQQIANHSFSLHGRSNSTLQFPQDSALPPRTTGTCQEEE